MKWHLAIALAFTASLLAAPSTRPTAGKVEIIKKSEVKAGMKGTAWTVLAGTEPEAIPVEIIGLWQNASGPKQDLFLCRMSGKALQTQVAGGMSGSPVYLDGKLAGAVSYRIGAFTAEPICGITPIEQMLEINDFDESRPAGSKTPSGPVTRAAAGIAIPSELLARAVAAGASPDLRAQAPLMVPIETPLTLAGFTEDTIRQFGPLFNQMGMHVAQGGASSTLLETKPAIGWQKALNPGESFAGVLVSGDMSISGFGTVTANDGKRVLAMGHPFTNLGPVDMPMSKGEVLMTLSSQFQPTKFGNTTEIVGVVKQDRHNGMLGELGTSSEMIPVSVKVRTMGDGNTVRMEKDLRFNVFVSQKLTPTLMMVTLFNSINGMNDFADEATIRLSGNVELEGNNKLSLNTMLAPSEIPIPPSMLLAGWWGDKFNRLFGNAVQTPPKLKSVNATIDLLPQRRIATIENAWVASADVEAGAEVPVKVYLRPYRGERIEKEFKVKIPAGMPKGDHRILLSDADTLNRMQSMVGFANRFMDIPETVSLINQERSNNRLYVSLVQPRPTFYDDDKTMPSLPASVLNVMQAGRAASRPLVSSPESTQEQLSIPFDLVVNGSQSLKITIK